MLPRFVQKMHARFRRRLWDMHIHAAPRVFRAASTRDPSVADDIADYEKSAGYAHVAGSLPLRTLLRAESLLPAGEISSVETGCGKSTIFLSRIGARHKVFCLDDRGDGARSSVDYFMKCPATRMENVETIFGPTQATLPFYKNHVPYDLILIDGPHGFPFPDLEYFYLYPHLKPGGLLVLDDIHIATIGRLADFLSEDAMFEKLDFCGSTALFRRTDAPVFDPYGDGWWAQNFNRRRADFNKEVMLRDGKRRAPIDFEGKF